MNKVKYTREEYRKEYLNSEEWQNLRALVMESKPDCQCCHKTTARDVHHLIYRNIVDIKVNELLPVCRECHKFIHKAIEDGYISQNPDKLEKIREKTIHILMDEDYEKLREWLSSKHHLDKKYIDFIHNDNSDFLIKRIRGATKKMIWYDDLATEKFTGRQIRKIQDIIRARKFQLARKEKDKKSKYIKIPKNLKKLDEKVQRLNKIKKRKQSWKYKQEITVLEFEIKEARKKFKD
jgi:hypothetical protein